MSLKTKEKRPNFYAKCSIAIALVVAIVLCLAIMTFMSVDSQADDNVTYLAFTSDVHNTDDNTTATRTTTWINNVSETVGAKFENMFVCGDLGSEASGYWSKVSKVIENIENNENVIGDGFYICGNHEYSDGEYNSTSDDTAKKFSYAGTYIIEDDYIVYSLGAESDKKKYSDDTIGDLQTFLEEHKDFDGPVFIVSHYPLHYLSESGSKEGSSTNGEGETGHSTSAVGSAKLISLLNNYSNVIYLWGHNHTSSTECYDEIHTDYINDSEINFTYTAAGCMCDRGQGKNIKGKGLVAEITRGSVILTYYTAEGTVVTSEVIDMPVAVTGVKLDKSELKMTAGESETLTASVFPEDATNSEVEWASSDESVATVEAGVVTAVSPGYATITVTSSDGSKTADCRVMICGVAEGEPGEYSGENDCINEIKLTSGGEVITGIQTGNFLVSASVTKSDHEACNTVMVAEYDSNGKYLGMVEVNLAEDSGLFDITVPVDNSQGNISKIKLFFVTGTQEPVPLCDCAEIAAN